MLFAVWLCAGCAAPPLNPRWQATFRDDVNYYNQTGAALPVRRAPSDRAASIGTVEPGRGGLIQDCHVPASGAARFCQVAVGALNALGWVDMAGMSPR